MKSKTKENIKLFLLWLLTTATAVVILFGLMYLLHLLGLNSSSSRFEDDRPPKEDYSPYHGWN